VTVSDGVRLIGIRMRPSPHVIQISSSDGRHPKRTYMSSSLISSLILRSSTNSNRVTGHTKNVIPLGTLGTS